MYTKWVRDTFRGQKRAPDLLELKLWMIVNHYVGAGNQFQVLCKNVHT